MDIFGNRSRTDPKDTKDEAELRPWRQTAGEATTRTESGSPSVEATPPTPVPVPEPAFARQAAVAGPTPPDDCASVVSFGSTWQGTLKIDGSVRIDGQFSGEVEAQDTVHIAEGARVDAKISATYVVVAGSFQGEMHCRERLELLPKSRTRGQLSTKLLIVHEGAFIDGQLHMSAEESAAAVAAPASRPTASPVRPQREPSPALTGSAASSAIPD